MAVIDFHAHYARQTDFLPRLLDHMPRSGIDRICLCSAGEEYNMMGNAEVRTAFEKHPEKITGLAFVRLGVDSPSVIDEYVRQGFAGIKIINPTSDYDDPAFFPVYERIEAHRLVVLFHTGIVKPHPTDRERDKNSMRMMPIRLDAVARAFPGMNIVAAHLGAPWHEEASQMARFHSNFYVDLTGAIWGGWRLNKNADFYRYHFFWPNAWEKIVFGTDILEPEELKAGREIHDKIFEPLALPPETMDKIYGGTAARLLKLSKETT
jgi:predicted TIM-barrel fold metal-dependent hydrolase